LSVSLSIYIYINIVAMRDVLCSLLFVALFALCYCSACV